MKRLTRLLTFTLALSTTSLLFSGTISAQLITTTAGGYVGDGGAATNAAFTNPSGILRDTASGAVYVSDFYAQRIRKITSGGIISTYAGTGFGGYNGDGIAANTAEISYPTGMTFDSAGNIIFADGGNSRVRKIDKATGIISTIAGNGVFGNTGDGGPATSAEIGQPWGVIYDTSGNLYIADIAENVVRIVNSVGTINTFAGTGTAGFTGDGGPAKSAEIFGPSGLAIDTSKNVYIADRFNHRVRKVNTSGIITTFAGNGNTGATGDGGPATSAAIGNPKGLSLHNGVLYITNGGKSRVRSVVLSTKIISTFAGSSAGYDGDGLLLASSQFFSPASSFLDSTGNLYITDSLNSRVRKEVNTLMMTIGGGYLGDGTPAVSAALYFPEAIAFDKNGNYYLAEYGGNRVRQVSTAGIISTLAGTGISGYTGDGGPATLARLYFPNGVVADSSLNVYISDQANNVIRKVTHSTGNISTFATYANWSALGAMAMDSSGNIFVVDQGTCAVYKVDTLAVVTLVAGVEFVCGYNGDNINANTAQLNQPYGVALNSSGDIYIADANNNRIRKVNASTSKITTVAGNGTCGFSGDGGLPTSAELCFPEDVVLNSGITYIADTANIRIRKISGNVISTWAGTGTFGYNGDGLPALSTNLDDPIAITKNAAGTIFELDDVQSRVRKIK